MGRGLKGIVLGGAIGAALGILYAPRAGKKTRALLAEKTDALWGENGQNPASFFGGVATTAKSAVEAGQNFFNEATGGKFSDFTKDAKAKVKTTKEFAEKKAAEFKDEEDVRPAFAEKNEELRKKIDTAREKIASQVAKNLEDHQHDSVDVKPAAVKTKPVEEKPKKKEPKPPKKDKDKK